MKTDDTLLYCRSCKRLINSEVESCPQCGADDPFFKYKIFGGKILPSIIIGVVFCFIGLAISLKLFGSGTMGTNWLAYFIAIFLGFIAFKVSQTIFGKKKEEEARRKMRQICDEMDDLNAYVRWETFIKKKTNIFD